MLKQFILLVLAALLITGCTKSTSQNAFSDDNLSVKADEPIQTIKVGVLGPFTGTQKSYGDEFKAAIRLAFSPIDYKIGNYKIELVYIDSQSDAEKAAAAYEKAIVTDHINVGFMGWNSAATLACMEVSAKHQIPHFFSFGTSDAIDNNFKTDPEKYKYWVGKGWPASSKLVTAYVTAFESAIEKGEWNPKNRNIASFIGNSVWSEDFVKDLEAAFAAKDWNIIHREHIVDGTTDYNQAISNIKNADPSIIIGTTESSEVTAKVLSELKRQNVNAMIVADGLGQNTDWYKLTGDASNLVLDQIPSFVGARAESFTEEFMKENNWFPSPSVGGMCFDWSNYFIKVMQYTLEQYGSISKETLMQCVEQYMKTGKLVYKSGTVHYEYIFTQDSYPDPLVGEGAYIFPAVQYMNGEGQIVWPDNSKTDTIKFKP